MTISKVCNNVVLALLCNKSYKVIFHFTAQTAAADSQGYSSSIPCEPHSFIRRDNSFIN